MSETASKVHPQFYSLTIAHWLTKYLLVPYFVMLLLGAVTPWAFGYWTVVGAFVLGALTLRSAGNSWRAHDREYWDRVKAGEKV